jgi:hypothetical protein
MSHKAVGTSTPESSESREYFLCLIFFIFVLIFLFVEIQHSISTMKTELSEKQENAVLLSGG